MIEQRTLSWLAYLLSMLIFTIIGSLLFGGMKSLMDYRKSVEPGLQVNLGNLRFFTKEYIQRRYQAVLANSPPSDSFLPVFRLYTSEQDLEFLNSDLPASGKTRLMSGHLSVDKPPFKSEVGFRYRGGLALHWLYDKKSLRIRLPPYTTYQRSRGFDLVNPSTLNTITDWLSYDMARSVGLLTPEYFPARVYINERYNGLHYFLDRIDESFLRKNRRMPGSIYSGDTRYVPNPFGSDAAWRFSQVFAGKEGEPLMWRDERLWEKDAARNAESEEDRSDIQLFIDTLNESDALVFARKFEQYFDKEKFYRFWGLDAMVGAYHHDYFHNQKIYFDPYKGRFEPIEWDLRFWSANAHLKYKDFVITPLLRQVILNPVFEYERDKITYEMLSRFPVEDVVARIREDGASIRRELEADPVRQQPDPVYGNFRSNKEVPFTLSEYDRALKNLAHIYRIRHNVMNAIYEECFAGYTLQPVDFEHTRLTISVSGNSPIDFDPWSLVPPEFRSKVSIFQQHDDGKGVSVWRGRIQRLYPGRSIKTGNAFGRADYFSILAFGTKKIVPAPIHYQYMITGIAPSALKNPAELPATNSITGAAVPVRPLQALPDADGTDSVHPWTLPSHQSESSNEVILSGDIRIDQDKIYSKHQQVRILPGTMFKLSEGKSLVFYGRVLAEGTPGAPIKFMPAGAKPWGSIIIQGRDASGSLLRHIEVSGGSVAELNLIHYPAQLSIHDVDSFVLEDCIVRDNYIGDDALHVAYSNGEIRRCRFSDTAFDALDMDIVDVSVSDLEFHNIGNDALDLMTSKVTATNVYITGTGDKCFSVGEESNVYISGSRLYNCETGIAVKDGSYAEVDDLIFAGFKQSAIALYQKNARYGVGGTISGRHIKGVRASDIYSDKKSVNQLSAEALLSAQSQETRGGSGD